MFYERGQRRELVRDEAAELGGEGDGPQREVLERSATHAKRDEMPRGRLSDGRRERAPEDQANQSRGRQCSGDIEVAQVVWVDEETASALFAATLFLAFFVFKLKGFKP